MNYTSLYAENSTFKCIFLSTARNDISSLFESRGSYIYMWCVTKGVIDWRIWIECERTVWSEQRWPNRTKQGCSTQNVRISYKDSVKAVQNGKVHFHSSHSRCGSWCGRSTYSVFGRIWPMDHAHSAHTCLGFAQLIMLTRSTLAWDSPN